MNIKQKWNKYNTTKSTASLISEIKNCHVLKIKVTLDEKSVVTKSEIKHKQTGPFFGKFESLDFIFHGQQQSIHVKIYFGCIPLNKLCDNTTFSPRQNKIMAPSLLLDRVQ